MLGLKHDMTILAIAPDLVLLQLPLDEVRPVHACDEVLVAMAGRSEDGEPPQCVKPTCARLRRAHAKRSTEQRSPARVLGPMTARPIPHTHPTVHPTHPIEIL